AGVLRTRNTLNDNVTASPLKTSRTHRLDRDIHRAIDLLVNKDDIREHVLLNTSTVAALQHLEAGENDEFLSAVLKDKLVASDMLVRIGRGPIFEDWHVKRLVFEAVVASNGDFDKGMADNAVAATAHYLANNGMVKSRVAGLGHPEWKSESEEGLQKYFDEIDASTTSSNIFKLFAQIILQFGTPANIASSTVEDLIARAALAYAIILQASTRAIEQLVRDTTAHAAKVSLDVSVIFAAITLGSSVAPSPYAALVVDSVEGVIQTVITNYVNDPVTAITAVASNLSDQFANYVLKPALAGDSVPGLFPGNASAASPAPPASTAGSEPPVQTPSPVTPAPIPAAGGGTPAGAGAGGKAGANATPTPALTPAAKRRQLGQLFQSKYQDYIGMLDTVHTPMRKI
ncbi:hypothetical protein LSUE1_G008234, partial [Lachnellula suecica]